MYSNKETDAEYEMMMQAALSSGSMSMPVMRKKTQAEMFMDNMDNIDTETSKDDGAYGSYAGEPDFGYKKMDVKPDRFTPKAQGQGFSYPQVMELELEFEMPKIPEMAEMVTMPPIPYDTALAMAYIPYQQKCEPVYEPDNALRVGTLFKELDIPFTAGKRC